VVTPRDASTTARLCLARWDHFSARVEGRSIETRGSAGAVGLQQGRPPRIAVARDSDVRNTPGFHPVRQRIFRVGWIGPCFLGSRRWESGIGAPLVPISTIVDRFCIDFDASGLERMGVFVRGSAICWSYGEDPRGMREGGCGHPMKSASGRGFGGPTRPQRSRRRLDRLIPFSLHRLRCPRNRVARDLFAARRSDFFPVRTGKLSLQPA